MLQLGRFAEVGLTALGEVQADVVSQVRLIVLGDEDIVRAARNEMAGELALCEQGIGGDGLAGDVDGIKDRDGHPDLVGAFQFVAAVDGERGDFFWVWQLCVW